jgi:hypothetical protein
MKKASQKSSELRRERAFVFVRLGQMGELWSVEATGF